MIGTRRSLFIGSLIGASLGLVCYAFGESLVNAYNVTARLIGDIANFSVAGYHFPWKYLFICMSLVVVLLYFKVRKLGKQTKNPKPAELEKDGPVVVSGKTLFEIHTASQNIKELTRRLDSAEKTTHLVMRQLEAMTKCLTEVLKEDKFKSINNNKLHVNPSETHL